MNCMLTRRDKERMVVARCDLSREELIIIGEGRVSGCYEKHAFQIDWSKWWVPKDITAYFRHSANPSVGIRVSRSGPPLFYVLKDIRKGEELSLDYATFEALSFKNMSEDRRKCYGEYVADYLKN